MSIRMNQTQIPITQSRANDTTSDYNNNPSSTLTRVLSCRGKNCKWKSRGADLYQRHSSPGYTDEQIGKKNPYRKWISFSH